MNPSLLLGMVGVPMLLTACVMMTAYLGFSLTRDIRRQNVYKLRVAALQGGIQDSRGASGKTKTGSATVQLAIWLGSIVLRSGLLSVGTQKALQQTLLSSGVHGNGIALFLGVKAIGLMAMPLLTMLLLQGQDMDPLLHSVLVPASGAVGLLAPEWVLKRIRARYIRKVESGLPDALDMMVICADAGFGLEASLGRVKNEIQFAHPAVALELGQTVSELRLTADLRSVLLNLGARTGLDGLKRLASVLIQATQYGTPFSTALRGLSEELRRETTARFEARAARLPVMLTLPLIMFILPCVFLVVGGPAVITLVSQVL